MNIKNIAVKILLAGAIAFGLCERASAQGDYDWYALSKPVSLFGTNSLVITNAAANVTNYSAALDVGKGKFVGSGIVLLWAQTNLSVAGGAGSNSVTFTPQTSPDNTNWSNVTNYALSTNLSTVYTNINYIGTNGTSAAIVVTNSEPFPFVQTTPTPATAGFATSYPLPEAFTNSGAFTPVYGQLNAIGIQNISDLPEYFRVAVVLNGTNGYTGTFVGRRSK